MLEKVDLTKYTEQHEFYFDEVRSDVTLLRLERVTWRCGQVFHEETTNMEIYRRTCEPLVDYVFKQVAAVVLAVVVVAMMMTMMT